MERLGSVRQGLGAVMQGRRMGAARRGTSGRGRHIGEAEGRGFGGEGTSALAGMRSHGRCTAWGGGRRGSQARRLTRELGRGSGAAAAARRRRRSAARLRPGRGRCGSAAAAAARRPAAEAAAGAWRRGAGVGAVCRVRCGAWVVRYKKRQTNTF
tara:strand:- start:5 stop:469 length:465 start_codon:yes stop_codon:yes gene_type:complete